MNQQIATRTRDQTVSSFKLRRVAIILLVVACVFAVVVQFRKSDGIEQISQLGGIVYYRFDGPNWLYWLKLKTGYSFGCDRWSSVELFGPHVQDGDLLDVDVLPIESLAIMCSSLTARSADWIASQVNVTDLWIGMSQVDDEWIRKIASLPNVVNFNLPRTQVTDESVRLILGWRQLRGVDISFSKISPAGIDLLLTLPSLESVSIDETQISSQLLERAKAHSIDVRIETGNEGYWYSHLLPKVTSGK